MSIITIKDIYAGVPDAKDDQSENFFRSFVLPPGLDTETLLSGKKFLILGYKGVGKTSVLLYLENQLKDRDNMACTSFLYFKSGFEEVRKSNMETFGKKLTAFVDVSGEIQPSKVEYLHLWRWIFFKKIVDDSENCSNGLFADDEIWDEFKTNVKKIDFTSSDKKVISLSNLSISIDASGNTGLTGKISAFFEPVSKSEQAFKKMIEIVDHCEALFPRLTRTDIPYYLFVDEMEAYYGDFDLFTRDLTLIRDVIFTIHRLNSYGKVRIIGAVRSEILFAMDRYIPTREINKITDGFSVSLKWAYSNTNSYSHPIIKILMKRIEIASHNKLVEFQDWFPDRINGKESVNYILDNGWCKPRDIVRLLIAAQNDSMHCNDTKFTLATFDTLRKEYSKNSLAEIRQELQGLYGSADIEMVFRLLRGGEKIFAPESVRKKTKKGSNIRALWDEKGDQILEDFYRVGFWGNVNRNGPRPIWRWNHKGDTGVLTDGDWELVIHDALCSELSIVFN